MTKVWRLEALERQISRASSSVKKSCDPKGSAIKLQFYIFFAEVKFVNLVGQEERIASSATAVYRIFNQFAMVFTATPTKKILLETKLSKRS